LRDEIDVRPSDDINLIMLNIGIVIAVIIAAGTAAAFRRVRNRVSIGASAAIDAIFRGHLHWPHSQPPGQHHQDHGYVHKSVAAAFGSNAVNVGFYTAANTPPPMNSDGFPRRFVGSSSATAKASEYSLHPGYSTGTSQSMVDHDHQGRRAGNSLSTQERATALSNMGAGLEVSFAHGAAGQEPVNGQGLDDDSNPGAVERDPADTHELEVTMASTTRTPTQSQHVAPADWDLQQHMAEIEGIVEQRRLAAAAAASLGIAAELGFIHVRLPTASLWGSTTAVSSDVGNSDLNLYVYRPGDRDVHAASGAHAGLTTKEQNTPPVIHGDVGDTAGPSSASRNDSVRSPPMGWMPWC
jgi:hypothetical protein